MPESIVVPGPRDVRGTLSTPDAEACVVTCPPHPQHGGSRSDGRLRAAADALGDRGVACLRFDYGPWGEGRGEATDAEHALLWAAERYEGVGLFGYSFGAALALVVAGSGGEHLPTLCAVSALAPPAQIESLDAVDAIDRIDAPLQVLHGERDQTVDWEPVVEAAREAGASVVSLSGDHFFLGAEADVGEAVAGFLGGHCESDAAGTGNR